jgi:hypothetical protein
MDNENGSMIWETVCALFFITLILSVTPLFIDVVEGGNKKRRMEYSAHQLARSLIEGWKNGQTLYAEKTIERDGVMYQIHVTQAQESLHVEKCQVTIRWIGMNHREEVRSITAFRYRETEVFHE